MRCVTQFPAPHVPHLPRFPHSHTRLDAMAVEAAGRGRSNRCRRSMYQISHSGRRCPQGKALMRLVGLQLLKVEAEGPDSAPTTSANQQIRHRSAAAIRAAAPCVGFRKPCTLRMCAFPQLALQKPLHTQARTPRASARASRDAGRQAPKNGAPTLLLLTLVPCIPCRGPIGEYQTGGGSSSSGVA